MKYMVATTTHQTYFYQVKKYDKLFSGILYYSWPNALDGYDAVSRCTQLKDDQKLDGLALTLRGDAYHLYNKYVSMTATSFDKSFVKLSEQYNFDTQQELVKNRLESVRLTDFPDSETSEEQSLSKATKTLQP